MKSVGAELRTSVQSTRSRCESITSRLDQRHEGLYQCTLMAGVTLKCLSRGEIITKFPRYMIAPSETFPPTDNLPVKIHPARVAAGWGGFLPVNCRPEEDFSWRRSYNGAPASSIDEPYNQPFTTATTHARPVVHRSAFDTVAVVVAAFLELS